MKPLLCCSFIMLGAFGCSDPCEDLREACKKCPDLITRAHCEKDADQEEEEACDAAMHSYELVGCQ